MPTLAASRLRIAAVLASVVALLAGALLTASPTAAAPVNGATYMGVSAKLDAISLSVNPNGSAVQTFVIGYPANTVQPGCSTGGSFNAATASFSMPIANSSFDSGPLQGPAEFAWFKGTFGDDGLATGQFLAGPAGLAQCTARDMRWVAVTRPGTTTPATGATFSGTASTNGSVAFLTSTNGQTVAGFTLNLAQSCANVSTPAGVTLTDGMAAWIATNTAGTTTARLRMGISGNQASGAYAIDVGIPSCPPIIGTFTARVGGTATVTPVPSAAPVGTPAATPAPGATTGTLVSGTVPTAGGFGLIVYGGGTVAQLVTATKCPTASMALYIAQGGEFLTYVPGTSIGAVNQAFLAVFPNSTVPPNTALLGRCV